MEPTGLGQKRAGGGAKRLVPVRRMFRNRAGEMAEKT
jgi:hypothetical protein